MPEPYTRMIEIHQTLCSLVPIRYSLFIDKVLRSLKTRSRTSLITSSGAFRSTTPVTFCDRLWPCQIDHVLWHPGGWKVPSASDSNDDSTSFHEIFFYGPFPPLPTSTIWTCPIPPRSAMYWPTECGKFWILCQLWMWIWLVWRSVTSPTPHKQAGSLHPIAKSMRLIYNYHDCAYTGTCHGPLACQPFTKWQVLQRHDLRWC